MTMKKFLKGKTNGVSTAISEAGRQVGNRLGGHLRLKARARLINSWGRKHPKLVFTSFFAMMGICVCISAIYVLTSSGNGNGSMGQDLELAKASLEGSAKIRAMESASKALYGDVLDRAIACGQELDSLMRLEGKTRDDSIRMVVLSEQFKIYKKALNNEED